MSQWHSFYKKQSWYRRRAHQLRIEPLCRMCKDSGKAIPATVVDHVEPHRGDYDKFVLGKLQSLCFHHHNSVKQSLEYRGYNTDLDATGWPVDPNHPANSGIVGRRELKEEAGEVSLEI